MPVRGLAVTGPLLAAEDQIRLLAQIDAQDWTTVTAGGRRVQHYGFNYNYTSRKVTPGAPMPDFLSALVAPFPTAVGWDQCIVNEYRPGQGISWHTDAKVFGPAILCYTLGDPHPMQFRVGGLVQSITPAPGSAYAMAGEARTFAQHRMTPFVGTGRPGSRRVSVTFRSIAA